MNRPLRHRSLWLYRSALVAAAVVVPGFAAVDATEIPWWDDPHEIPDLVLRQKLRAHGVWVGQDKVTCLGASCTIELEPYHFLNNAPSAPLCTDLEVFGLPRGTGFFGGVLVGDDLFLTVHNAGQGTCNNRLIVFGLAAESAASPLLDPLAPGETLNYSVPAADVYGCDEVLAGGDTGGWTLVRLDRPVTGRRPLKLQRSGLFDPGASTVTAGYPNRLPLKVEEAPLLLDTGTVGRNGAHVLGGSSGSLVLGPSRRLLGVVCCGNTGWWLEDGGCYRPDPAANAHATFDRPTGDDLLLVPAIGLDLVLRDPSFANPLVIDHYGPPGGPFTHEAVPHRLQAGAAGLPTRWALVLITDGIAYFRPEPGTPDGGILAPGQGFDFDIVATPEVFTAEVGLYHDFLDFADLTYGTNDVEMHRLFVGIDAFVFECVPDSPRPCDERFLGESGPSGAVAGESKRYRLTSRWATSQTITVSGPPWLSFASAASLSGGAEGGAANPLVLVLDGGRAVEVVATVVEDGTLGTVEGEIVFEASFAGETMHVQEVLARGDLGRFLVEAEPGLTFTPGTTVAYNIAIDPWPPETAVTDLDLCVHVTGAGPAPVPQDPPAFRLLSSTGLEIPLSASWGHLCWSDELFDPPPRLRVVEVQGLADVEGGPFGGSWTLVIESPPTAPWEEGTLELVSFRFLTEAPSK